MHHVAIKHIGGYSCFADHCAVLVLQSDCMPKMQRVFVRAQDES